MPENAPEMKEVLEGKEFYNPLWVKIEDMRNMLVYPLEIRDLILKDYKNNFTDSIKEFVIKISDLRESL
jgi:hypothetical protein